jgi:hypothetical protein
MRPDAAAASPRSGVRRGISSISIASREVITRGLPRSMSFGSTDLLLSWEISAMGQRLVRDKKLYKPTSWSFEERREGNSL